VDHGGGIWWIHRDRVWAVDCGEPHVRWCAAGRGARTLATSTSGLRRPRCLLAVHHGGLRPPAHGRGRSRREATGRGGPSRRSRRFKALRATDGGGSRCCDTTPRRCEPPPPLLRSVRPELCAAQHDGLRPSARGRRGLRRPPGLRAGRGGGLRCRISRFEALRDNTAPLRAPSAAAPQRPAGALCRAARRSTPVGARPQGPPEAAWTSGRQERWFEELRGSPDSP